MEDRSEEKGNMKIDSLVFALQGRTLPLVKEHSTIQEIINAMIRFGHSRVVYVVNEAGTLRGTISLGVLSRHVFSRNHEAQIHGRFLISMITAKTAKDIMQKHPVFAMKEEKIGKVLKRMIESNVKEIAILDKDRRVVGDVTMIDLLRFLLDRVESPEEEGRYET